jgi:hypothetical protein
MATTLACAGSGALAVDRQPSRVEPQDSHSARWHSDAYAWRLFLALNRPADPVTGAPDRHARLGADQPVIWELWPNGTQLFSGNAQPPAAASRQPAGKFATLDRFASPSLLEIPGLRRVEHGVMVPVRDPPDAALRLTELHLNEAAAQYVTRLGLNRPEAAARLYRDGASVDFPAAAKAIKARWRPIAPSERARYHTISVRGADGVVRLYGLTALHIATKDLPQWFWATFEHVDNPSRDGSEGWQGPSRDRLACPSHPVGCDRAPAGIGLEGTAWQYYRLRGTMTTYTDAAGSPVVLANSEFEAGFQPTSSCMTCHARAAIAFADAQPVTLPVFATNTAGAPRHGFIGIPDSAWFGSPAATGSSKPLRFMSLDFLWTAALAHPEPSPDVENAP